MAKKKSYRDRPWPHGMVSAVADKLGINMHTVSKALHQNREHRSPMQALAVALGERAAEEMRESPTLQPWDAVKIAAKSLRLRV